jgi:hypothetical protein
VSRKFSGLSKTARSVSNARSFETEYSNVAGMSPSGAQPTQIGDTEKPVLPRGRLDEGSITPFADTRLPSRLWKSSTLRRAPRRLFGVRKCLFDVLPQERFAKSLPDGVLDRRIVLVLGRDEGRLLRLLQ